jgi:single-strand DNA-binding protein
MRSINKVILIGNLTRDPEIRTTPGGQNVVTFAIATNREWVTKDGRKQSSTEFHDLVAWANLADICIKYLKKSKLVYVEGYLKTRNWNAPDGTKKFRTEVVVQDLIMLDKRSQDDRDDYIPEEEAHHLNPEMVSESDEDSFEAAPVRQQTQPRPPAPPKPHHEPNPEPKPERESEPQHDQEQKPSTPKSMDIDQDLGL